MFQKIHTICATLLLNHFSSTLTKKEETEVEFEDEIVCSKRCFNKLLKHKLLPPKKQSRFWGSDGPNKFIKSMSVLIDWWLTTGDNCSPWRGGDKHNGVTKKTIASGIGLLIKEKVGVICTSKDVRSKIESIERDFRAASDWLGQTGAGLESGAIKEYINRICPLYYQLEPVMKDRATTKPLYALGTALEDTDSEKESLSSDDVSETIIDVTETRKHIDEGNESDVPKKKRIKSLQKSKSLYHSIRHGLHPILIHSRRQKNYCLI